MMINMFYQLDLVDGKFSVKREYYLELRMLCYVFTNVCDWYDVLCSKRFFAWTFLILLFQIRLQIVQERR